MDAPIPGSEAWTAPLRLASPSGRMSRLVQEGVTGPAAALAVPHEAVARANEVLDTLDRYLHARPTETGAALLAETAWVLLIEHRHGTDTSAHRSKQGARARLVAYVDEW